MDRRDEPPSSVSPRRDELPAPQTGVGAAPRAASSCRPGPVAIFRRRYYRFRRHWQEVEDCAVADYRRRSRSGHSDVRCGRCCRPISRVAVLIVVAQSLSRNRCRAIIAAQSLPRNRCRAIVVGQSLPRNRCRAIVAAQRDHSQDFPCGMRRCADECWWLWVERRAGVGPRRQRSSAEATGGDCSSLPIWSAQTSMAAQSRKSPAGSASRAAGRCLTKCSAIPMGAASGS